MLLTCALGMAGTNFFYNIDFTVDKDERKTAVFVGIVEQPKFTKSSRGCGMGYVQSYVTEDGIQLSEGNMDCLSPSANDPRIVHRDDARIISKLHENGRVYYEIYHPEKGRCITSPTLELGLQLESFLNNQP